MLNSIKVWMVRISHSKTLWFNAIVAALAALEAVFSVMQGVLPGNVYAYLTVLLTVGNAILRVVTTVPLKDK